MGTDRQKRILFVSLYTEFGGGEYGLYYLIEHLDRARFSPILMVNRRGPLVAKVEQLGVEIVIVPFEVVMLQRLIVPGILFKNLKAAFAIKRYAAQAGIDLIQCSDVLALLLLLPAIVRFRLPIIYSVIFFYERVRAILFNMLALWSVQSITTLSRAVEDDLRRKTIGLNKKFRLVYWGVDTSRFHPITFDERRCLREKLSLPVDRKIIGFVGRYETWKGHRTFLDAAEELLQCRGDLFFLIVGGAMTEDVIPPVARYRSAVAERIRRGKFNGNLAVWDHRENVPEIMACFDVFVCPSDREPFGLVVTEALASGVPVVVSSGVGALEVVGDEAGVFVASPKDGKSFAIEITEALKSEKPSAQTARRLEWSSCADRYEDLYISATQRSWHTFTRARRETTQK